MGLRNLGDSAWLFQSGIQNPARSLDLILRLRQLLEKNPIPEIVDIVSSYDTIAVHFRPSDGETVLAHLTALHLDDVPAKTPTGQRQVTIPVAYGGAYGPDLQTLANAKALSQQELIRLHSEATYTVAAIGFAPGFPYLTGLTEALHAPRHSSPRPVAAGSVAVAADQAGIYPHSSQGGWHVLGRTGLPLFDPFSSQPTLLQPGDQVRFEVAETIEEVRPTAPPDYEVVSGITVLDPGPLSSIQDHGRYGYQHIGVSPGGAADPILATVANRLVGNPDTAAVIECTMSGPKLLFEQDARIAWVGWNHPSAGRPVAVKAGARVDLSGRTSHLRGYIAVAGGIDIPPVMGSRSTDIRGGFGGHRGRKLAANDRLPIGEAGEGPPLGSWSVAWPHTNRYLIELRFIRGMQAEAFTEESRRQFSKSFYDLSPASDRMGCRLSGAKLALKSPMNLRSQPVIAGSVQVPPDGQPIVLMSERQTIGGYPQIGHVISADIPILARAWPGARIHFREVSLDEARLAWFDLQRELGLLQSGLNHLT